MVRSKAARLALANKIDGFPAVGSARGNRLARRSRRVSARRRAAHRVYAWFSNGTWARFFRGGGRSLPTSRSTRDLTNEVSRAVTSGIAGRRSSFQFCAVQPIAATRSRLCPSRRYWFLRARARSRFATVDYADGLRPTRQRRATQAIGCRQRDLSQEIQRSGSSPRTRPTVVRRVGSPALPSLRPAMQRCRDAIEVL